MKIKSKNSFLIDCYDDDIENGNTLFSAKDLHPLIVQERDALVLKYLDTLPLNKGAKILDLGCGSGKISVNLLQRGFVVSGIDILEKMIDIARKNNTQAVLDDNTIFQSGNAEELDLPNDTFDVVIATGLIEYLTWDRWALQEIHRVLKPRGHLIVTVPNNIGLSNITNAFHVLSNFEVILGILQRNFKGISGAPRKPPIPYYRNFYIPSRFRSMLSGLGFDITDSLSHGFGPFAVLNRSNRISIKINRFLNRYGERKIIPFLSELGKDIIVLCRKRDKDDNRKYIFTNLEKRVKSFESEHKEFFTRCTTWIHKNPDYSHPNLQEFNTRAYSRKNVLVISPHPDDEIIGCGGTLIKMLAEGSNVTILQLTDGSSTSALKNSPEPVRKTIRLQEAKVVAEKLGITELIFFNEEQSGFTCTENNVKKLSEILNRLHPQVIFVPFINDTHPDHVVANEILRKSLESSTLNLQEVNVLSYEVWSFVPPNSFCIIDNQFDKKAEMLMNYHTGMKVIDYIHFCEDLNLYHAYILLGKRGFAEVFLNTDAGTYLEMVKKANIPR